MNLSYCFWFFINLSLFIGNYYKSSIIRDLNLFLSGIWMGLIIVSIFKHI